MMNRYDITISDIYEKGKSKKISIDATNVYSAHKQGLRHTNALREEILKIMREDNLVYSFKNGFSEE
jgi:hypothetical protein